jgi:hypothetical protein
LVEGITWIMLTLGLTKILRQKSTQSLNGNTTHHALFMTQRVKTRPSKQDPRTVLRTFRLPRELDEALVAGAKLENQTLTGTLLSILTQYGQYDRFIERFGFITVNRGTFKAMMDALPDDKISEIAQGSAVNIVEYIDFCYNKRDLQSLLGTIENFSKYRRRYDYDLARDDLGVTITLRTDLGEKDTLFIGEQYKAVISQILGVAPLVKMSQNQVSFRIGKTLSNRKIDSDSLTS